MLMYPGWSCATGVRTVLLTSASHNATGMVWCWCTLTKTVTRRLEQCFVDLCRVLLTSAVIGQLRPRMPLAWRDADVPWLKLTRRLEQYSVDKRLCLFATSHNATGMVQCWYTLQHPSRLEQCATVQCHWHSVTWWCNVKMCHVHSVGLDFPRSRRYWYGLKGVKLWRHGLFVFVRSNHRCDRLRCSQTSESLVWFCFVFKEVIVSD